MIWDSWNSSVAAVIDSVIDALSLLQFLRRFGHWCHVLTFLLEFEDGNVCRLGVFAQTAVVTVQHV